MTSDKTIRAAENGHLGQERCSALLAERFWVLRRSVDLDGADFLIQLNDPTIRFTDPLPPRLGIVQSKFSQDAGTSHLIPSKYVIDDRTGEPHEGFFLLIHMGKGKDKKRFLLTAAQIAEHLNKTADHEFRIGARAYSDEFDANDDEAALDIIEEVLRNRSDVDSKRFLHSVQIPEYPLKRGNLEQPWLLPIPNEVAFIPDQIYLVKHALKSMLDCLAAPSETIGDILMERDVAKLLDIIEHFQDDSSVIEQEGKYRLSAESPSHIDSDLLAEAAAVHLRRYGMLAADAAKKRCYDELRDSIREVCLAKLDELEPKSIAVPGGLRFVPYECLLSFDVDASNHRVTNLTLAIDDEHQTPRSGTTVTISRKIFTSIDGSKLDAVRDMHQVIHLAMVEYFRKLFPDEPIGQVKLPRLFMD